MKTIACGIWSAVFVFAAAWLYGEENNKQLAQDEKLPVTFSQNAYSVIIRDLDKTRDIRVLDQAAMRNTGDVLHAWAGGTIDFDLAVVRQASRYTSYRRRVKTYHPRLVTERLEFPDNGPDGDSPPRLHLEKEIGLATPQNALVREGENYFSWYFSKQTRFTEPYDEKHLARLVTRFIRENKFIIENQEDRIDSITVSERRIDEEIPGTQKAGDDYLVQTDVRLYRSFMGLPVENSVVTVGILPDQNEIVRLQHTDWSPVSADGTNAVVSAPQWSFDHIKEKLLALLLYQGITLEEVHVEQASPGWFQTKTALLPVLVLQGEMKHVIGKRIESQEFRMAVNLGGDEKEIYMR